MQWSSEGKVLSPPPPPILSRFLTVPNSSCIIDPWRQLQNLNTGRNSYRRAQRAVELSTP